MKRELICLLVLFYFSSIVFAGSGVSPAFFKENFEPNLEKEYTFMYFFEGGNNIEFYLSGELSEYAKITQVKRDAGRYFVNVKMKLPDLIKTPGENIIRVGGREIVNDEFSDEGISIAFDVGSRIIIFVPYPGRYAEIALKVDNINQGEEAKYQLKIDSKGDKDISVNPRMEISNKEGVKKLENLPKRDIKSKESYTYKTKIDTTTLPAGDYNLTAFVDYGGSEIASQIKKFRVGELRVDINSYTKDLEAEKVSRFQINIESFWNEPISNVYAEVTFPNHPTMNAKTNSITLKPWTGTFVNAFIDTTGIEDEEVDGTITVFYEGKTSTKDVRLKILKPLNWVVIGVISFSVFVITLVIGLLIVISILIRRNKKLKNKK